MNKIPDIIYLNDVNSGIDKLHFNGIESGNTTYISELDNHFRFLKGNLIGISGIPGHGKSTFSLYLMLLQSINNGAKWAIFSPESFPAELFYADLCRMYLMKSVINGYKDKCTAMELNTAKRFIGDHFFNLYPETESPTPDLIFSRFEQVIKQHNVDGCVIDPFNQLDNDWRSEGRDDLYISKFLSKCKRFAQQHNIYQIVITHPKVMAKPKGELDYQQPDIYDFHGGSMWGNKLDDLLIIHRPEKTSNPESKMVSIESVKIKRQPYCGVTGKLMMYYCPFKHRYYVDGLAEQKDVSEFKELTF